MIGPKRSRRAASNQNRISPQTGADADRCAWSVFSIAGRPSQRSPFACRGVRSWNGLFLCRCYGSCPEPLLRRRPNKSYTFQRKSVAGKRPMQSTPRSTRQSMGFKLMDVSFASIGKNRVSRPIGLNEPSGTPVVWPNAQRGTRLRRPKVPKWKRLWVHVGSRNGRTRSHRRRRDVD
jgi:hypothetical protein